MFYTHDREKKVSQLGSDSRMVEEKLQITFVRTVSEQHVFEYKTKAAEQFSKGEKNNYITIMLLFSLKHVTVN